MKRETALEAIARVETALREGYRPAGHNGHGPAAIARAAEVAVKDGWCTSVKGFVSRVSNARLNHGLEPDESCYRPRVYQHCSKKHLHRYMAEFDFRYSNRAATGCEDQERALRALLGGVGKRLTYRNPNVGSSLPA